MEACQMLNIIYQFYQRYSWLLPAKVVAPPSRHGPDFHRPQSQITIDSPDFHLRQSQNCLRGSYTDQSLQIFTSETVSPGTRRKGRPWNIYKFKSPPPPTYRMGLKYLICRQYYPLSQGSSHNHPNSEILETHEKEWNRSLNVIKRKQ